MSHHTLAVCVCVCVFIHASGPVYGKASRSAARGANLKGALRRHWNNKKYGAGKLAFSTRERIYLKISATWRHALKNVRQPCSRPKNLKDYQFEEAPNSQLAQGAHILSRVALMCISDRALV